MWLIRNEIATIAPQSRNVCGKLQQNVILGPEIAQTTGFFSPKFGLETPANISEVWRGKWRDPGHSGQDIPAAHVAG